MGTISGEHGIGNKKSQFMELEISPKELAIMKRFKGFFDPKGNYEIPVRCLFRNGVLSKERKMSITLS